MRRPSRFGPHALPALAVTALVLAVPAGTLPVVSLSKFGQRHDPLLASGMDGLTQGGLPHLAVLVGACAIVAPVALAALLAGWWWFSQHANNSVVAAHVHRVLDFVQYWAMPEVYILGILIAFVKLGDLVHVHAQAGLWCYAAMAVAVLGAWRTFVGQFQAEAGATGPEPDA